MAEDVKCPLCQLKEEARNLLRVPNAEELAACATVPLVLAALPVSLGCQLVKGGAFLFTRSLYGAKSFVDAELSRINHEPATCRTADATESATSHRRAGREDQTDLPQNA